MHQLISSIQKILGDKKATRFILLFVIAGRIIQIIFFYGDFFDTTFQIIGMQNLQAGHGVSLGIADPADISTTIYTPLIKWPPGYSFLLLPFYIVSGKNFLIAGLLLDIFFSLVLMFYTRKILSLFDTPLYIINLFSLLTGLYIYSFYFINSSDAIAISIFLAALYYFLKFIKKEIPLIRALFLVGIPLISCVLLKYLYIPVVFVLPLTALTIGFMRKEKQQIKFGAGLFLLVGIGLFTLLIWQKTIADSAVYLSSPVRAFFPGNLSSFYPCLPASIVNPELFAKLIPGNDFLINRTYQIFHLAILALIVILFIRFFKKNKLQLQDPLHLFFLLSLLILFVISLTLAALSLRIGKEEILPGFLWTYIQEPRYYGLLTVLIHLSLFILFNHLNKAEPGTRNVFWLLPLLLLPEFFRGVIFDVRRIMLYNKEEYYWQADMRLQKFADEMISEDKAKKIKAVVAGTSDYVSQHISLYSRIPVLHDFSLLKDGQLKARNKTAVLLAVEEKELSSLQSLLSKDTMYFAGKIERLYFYKVYVGPD